MRRTSDYLLREIAGVPYLVPYGQPIADHRRSMRLNRTGAWLWQQMETEHTPEELLSLLAVHYAAGPEEMSFLKDDLSRFLYTMQSYGMLENHISEPEKQMLFCFFLDIGGMHIKIIGPREAIPVCFNAYSYNPDHTQDATGSIHQIITLHSVPACERPKETPLLYSRDLAVYDVGSNYLLFFPSMRQTREVLLSKDASRADFYCVPPWTESSREELFHAIRFVFLYLAEKHHMAALHSASFLYRGRAWLFAGSSGTGKSTHTNLWHQLLHVPLLNGDLNLMALENGSPVIHGLPWCGTSGISDCGTYLLGGIILLKQATEDTIETLSPDTRQLSVLQRLISPIWTPEQLDCCLDFVANLTSHIYVARLHCTKNHSAVETARKALDAYLDTLP